MKWQQTTIPKQKKNQQETRKTKSFMLTINDGPRIIASLTLVFLTLPNMY